MPSEIRMPRLDADMQEADLLAWLVEPGAVVEAGEVLLELETDKATVEFESPIAGTLLEILVPAGTTGVTVDTPLCLIEALNPEGAEQAESDPRTASAEAAPPARPAANDASSKARADTEADEAAPRVEPPPSKTGPDTAAPGDSVPATALARRMADQAGLDLSDVSGTGSRGRVTRRDVELELGAGRGAAASADPVQDQTSTPASDGAEPTLIPHTRMRRTIAERLSTAKQTIPHFYLQADCDASRLVEARVGLNAEASANGGEVRISLNDLVIRAAAAALREVPEANASWTDDAIIQHASVDIAIAVATESGLITPILRDVDRKGLGEISREMRDLAGRARAGKLSPREYQGGGFSISNLGMYGIDSVYPIINPPHACILGVGAAQAVPVVRDGELAVGLVMSLTLSADHRVVDGAVGARLLAGIKQRLEQPLDMLL
jgi:pyruvate dehydrogenase E2 component (dihydrolipoamide acetyltransferase)